MSLKDKLESHPIYIFLLGVLAAVGLLVAVLQVKGQDAQAGAIALGNPGETDVIETELPKFTVACSGKARLCDDYLDINLETRSKLRLRYYVGRDQCSSIRLHVLLNGTAIKRTEFLGWHGAPGESANLLLDTGMIDLGPVNAGPHNIRLQAEGQPSGCSRDGHVKGWGGALRLFTSSPVRERDT